MISLTITRSVENPDYKEEQAVSNRHYNGCEPMQSKMIEQNALRVEITEEQFEVIRKAVIDKF